MNVPRARLGHVWGFCDGLSEAAGLRRHSLTELKPGWKEKEVLSKSLADDSLEETEQCLRL